MHAYFSFLQIGSCVCVLYDIDLYSRLLNPAANSHTALGQGSKRARPALPSSAVTFELPLDDLHLYGSKLGHRYVLCNQSNPNLCEECHEISTQKRDLNPCNGSFLICVGQAFPIDGLGKQHQCNRGWICDQCILEIKKSPSNVEIKASAGFSPGEGGRG